MDTRRRVELQIRAVAVTYRRERRRLEAHGLSKMRDRGRTLLNAVEADASPYAELLAALLNVREELERDERLAADGFSQQPIDRGGELVDPERLR